jgi:hypothetical protein
VPSQIELPATLIDLIRSGRWPRVSLERRAEIDALRVRELFPEEDEIYFHAPPFYTPARRVRGGERFWSWPFAAPKELDPARAVVIGDFGLGSDVPIVLDYQHDPVQPYVRCLKVRFDSALRIHDSHWVTASPTFDEFAAVLKLMAVDWTAFRGTAEQEGPARLLLE